MGKNTGIEWTGATWNPIRGCSRVSEGCRNCYAERVAARFNQPGEPYAGLAIRRPNGEAQWTGEIMFVERHIDDPSRWKKPMRIFVNSMSDLFHPGVTAEMLSRIFLAMAKAPQHTYQILTKRPERLLESMDATEEFRANVNGELFPQGWPPPNWFFGVSIEDQATADHRLPILARTKCAGKFVSYEPALGPVDFEKVFDNDESAMAWCDWIIVGGESGPGSRPMHIEWARAVRDLCQREGIPFFFKQWGDWTRWEPRFPVGKVMHMRNDGSLHHEPSFAGASGVPVVRVGKKHAGSELDGCEWKEYPR